MNGFALELVSLMVSLTIVLGAAFIFLRILKRFQPGGEQSAELAFMRAVPIGPRERIVLIRWRDEVLLLGVTASQVTLISKAPAPADQIKDTDIDTDSEPPPPCRAGFGRGKRRAHRSPERHVALVDVSRIDGALAARALLGRASMWLVGGVCSIRNWSRIVRSGVRSAVSTFRIRAFAKSVHASVSPLERRSSGAPPTP